MEKRFLFLFMLLGFVIVVAELPCLDEVQLPGPGSLKKFSSYEELKSYVEAGWELRTSYNDWAMLRPLSFAAESSTGGTKTLSVYSTTNIQVEGVDEADFVKTDGEFIYIGSGRNVTILRAYPAEEAEVLSHVTLNGTLKGIFVNGNSLIILEETSDSYGSYEKVSVKTSVKVYDVANKANPVFRRDVPLDGYYFDSRMIDDYVYTLTNFPAYDYENEVVLPKIYADDSAEEIRASSIYYSNVSSPYYTFTTILAVNVQNLEQEPTSQTFLLGATRSIYVSLNNIYITFADSMFQAEILLWPRMFTESVERTAIHKVHIESGEIEYVASGEVPGCVLNQFSMGEHKGHFRIATTTGRIGRTMQEATSQNHIYVLDGDLNIVGKLENLAPGEKIYSARFMSGRCYLVTFRKVDPLFVVDLENPNAPKVLGQLKITGYSDYLHPYDENHIIGIGKETVAAEEGDFAWYQGVKISLFDVSDVGNPIEIAKFEIGDRGTSSPVLSDHKAFLFDKSKCLLVLPVLVAEIDQSKYPGGVPPYISGDYVWQGAYVFEVSTDKGLVFRGGITHIEDNIDLQRTGYYFSSSYSVKRTLYIDNVLYTISEKKVKMNSLENLDRINEVRLP